MTSHQRKSPGIKKALVTTGTAASLLGASFVAMPATFANVPDQVPTSPACDCQPGQPGQPGQGGQGQTGQPGTPGDNGQTSTPGGGNGQTGDNGQPGQGGQGQTCLLYTSPSPRDRQKSRMPSSA